MTFACTYGIHVNSRHTGCHLSLYCSARTHTLSEVRLNDALLRLAERSKVDMPTKAYLVLGLDLKEEIGKGQADMQHRTTI